ncbi:MAG: hypothetical protein Q4G24_02520 [Paracoccus sp. (in: a-proteobacteria)]|uniref:hypothetical protein n=1 Tax=Paracoccus sp. TaxID=267 RepID=UPI0026E0E071|nr:hypothetical protein [Paracoccus sp. (in: a-proteobacteria)]MDO5620328.1 hypothetical protein [Paracoccus sp. (in: a-proteobacteria)]
MTPPTAGRKLLTNIDRSALQRAANQIGGITGDAAKATTGYRAAMYGEIGVGNRALKIGGEMRFGAIAPGSTLADRAYTSRTTRHNNYSIDDFSRQDRRGYFARNSMASSQATVNYGRTTATKEGLRPSQISFEAKRADGRVMDVSRPGHLPGTQIDTEIKAGRSVSSGQVRLDEKAANAARKMEYVFADNPVTGAKGPNAKATSRLNTAAARSGGHINSSYRPDISAKPSTMKAVQASSVTSKVLRGAGKVAIPVGLVVDTVLIGSAVKADGGKFGSNTKTAVAASAGGWAGAAGGAAAGAKIGALAGALGGPAGAAVGAVAGGIIGGIAGAIGGSTLGEKLGKLW